MRADGKNICGAIRDVNPGAGERHDHRRARKVTGWMPHPLISRGDAKGCGVIVNSEVNAGAAPLRRIDKAEERAASIRSDDRLGSLNHEFQAQGAARQTEARLEPGANL